ncbi:MAG TPA: hypothetical protein VI072_22735 [Polyangiaceae bacterium]
MNLRTFRWLWTTIFVSAGLIAWVGASGCSSEEKKPAANAAQCDGTLESLRAKVFVPRCGQSGSFPRVPGGRLVRER